MKNPEVVLFSLNCYDVLYMEEKRESHRLDTLVYNI